MVGRLQVTVAKHKDTFADIARRFNVGYTELVRANPGVDPWLPGEGTQIVLPTEFILPDAPREGLVLNLAQMRLYYYPEPKKDGTSRGHHAPDRHRQGRLGDSRGHDQGRLARQGSDLDAAGVRAQGAREGGRHPAADRAARTGQSRSAAT